MRDQKIPEETDLQKMPAETLLRMSKEEILRMVQENADLLSYFDPTSDLVV